MLGGRRRSLSSAVLERFGYEVTAVRNGNEALASHRERPADLVITDLVMPEKEGVETIRKLRQVTPDAKIIAMSGGGRNKSNTYLQLARQLGAARVLSCLSSAASRGSSTGCAPVASRSWRTTSRSSPGDTIKAAGLRRVCSDTSTRLRTST